MVCSDPDQVRALEHRIYQIAEEAAAAWVELASLKLRRVLQTAEEIALHHALPDRADALLSLASSAVDVADHSAQITALNGAVGQ